MPSFFSSKRQKTVKFDLWVIKMNSAPMIWELLLFDAICFDIFLTNFVDSIHLISIQENFLINVSFWKIGLKMQLACNAYPCKNKTAHFCAIFCSIPQFYYRAKLFETAQFRVICRNIAHFCAICRSFIAAQNWSKLRNFIFTWIRGCSLSKVLRLF